MCKVLKFQGTGASFRSRLSPGARLWYRPGADICYRIENHKRVQLKYLLEERAEAWEETRKWYYKILSRITPKQVDKLRHLDTTLEKVRELKKHTKSSQIHLWITSFICDHEWASRVDRDVERLRESIKASA